MSQHRPTMVSGSCKRDAVWNSSAVLARQDEVEIVGRGSGHNYGDGSFEVGTVDSVLACLNSIISSHVPISLFLLQQCLYISMHVPQLLCDGVLRAIHLLRQPLYSPDIG